MENNFWKNKKVLVCGGSGFIGSHLVEMLVERKARVTVSDNLSNGKLANLKKVIRDIALVNKDLRNLDNCLLATKNQEIILNLAAAVGGISYNQQRPGSMFKDNILLSTHLLEAARINRAERFLVVSSACVYRRDCPIPTPESEGFVGSPEPTNDGYGWAKRMAEFQAQAYAREFGMQIAIARPYNAYGPRDTFELEKAHVIPALIKKIFDGNDPLIVWGSGEQTRAFLYVEDFARGLMELTEKYAEGDPVNIGTEEEMRIKDLVKLIIELTGFKGRVVFDASKPVGQPRRNCDTAKAKEKIGFTAQVSLGEGLKKTIDWFRANHR